MQPIAMKHEVSPEQAILKELGSLDGVEVFNNHVLVAVYIRPEKTRGGIILANQTREEDRYQSKVGLLVKCGESAFLDDTNKWFAGKSFKLKDWLVFKPSDGWQMTVNGVLCRLLADTEIRGRIDNPDRVW